LNVEPGSVNFLKLVVRESPAAESECIPRIKLNRPVEVCDGQPVLAGLIVGQPAVVVGRFIVVIQSDRDGVVSDGPLEVAYLTIGKPSDLVAVNVVGNQVERAGERIDRLLKIPAFYEHSAVVQVERSGRRHRGVRDWHGRGRAVICWCRTGNERRSDVRGWSRHGYLLRLVVAGRLP